MVSIIVSVGNTKEKWLRPCIESVRNQVYDNWELCIVYSGPSSSHIEGMLKEYSQKNKRIRIKFLAEKKEIAGNLNEALSLVNGEYVGFLGSNDEIDSSALYEIVKLLNKNKDTDFIYTDEDKISTEGKRFEPHFKPDWSPDTFRSYNYISHFAVIRKDILDKQGGFREGFGGAYEYDLFLRTVEITQKIIHIPRVLYHLRYDNVLVEGSTGANTHESAKKALKEHIQRMGMQGDLKDGHFPGSYRIVYQIKGTPTVSIIIPTKDKAKVLKKCINSILHKSSYTNYKILVVDNRSKEDETFRYFEELKDNPKINILKYDKEYNFSSINNYAVNHVDSEYIIFLNNDTEIISPDWIEAMLEFVQREDVGAVGALLYYPNETIQHAGVIIGIGGVAGYAHWQFPRNSAGYNGRIEVIQNLSAVTAACLMARKNIFKKVRGFDENYSIAYNDIDLCMKIRERGYLIVYTPYAELYHYESLSRGAEDTEEKQLRFFKETRYFQSKWVRALGECDPYYNPNLSLFRNDFSLKDESELKGKDSHLYELYQTVWKKDIQIYKKDVQIYDLNTETWEKNIQIQNLHDTISKKDALVQKFLSKRGKWMKIKDILRKNKRSELNKVSIRFLIVSGIGSAPHIYRCLNLKEQLYYLGYHQVKIRHEHEVIPLADARENEIIILNRPGKSPNIIKLISLCKINGNILLYSTDDLVTDHDIEKYLRLDKFMSVSELARFHEGVDFSMEIIKSCDSIIVSTDYLKSQLIDFKKKVYVLENALNEKLLEKAEKLRIKSLEKKKNRNEIILGYFSGWPNDHDYDFAMIKDAVFSVLSKHKNVKLRIVGYLEIDECFDSFDERIEKIDFVPFDVLPKYIADVDVNIIPLEPNPHKRSKSAIKFLEAALLKVPTIASNLEPYNGTITHPEDGLLCSNSKEWEENLQLLVEDASLRQKIADKAYHKVRSEHTTIVRSTKLRDIIKDILITNKIRTPLVKDNKGRKRFTSRQDLANEYIKGNGIEVGALNNPLSIDHKLAKVKYVDRKPVETLRDHYQELEQDSLLSPDIIASAEDLKTIPDSSQDFVIANHLLEHSPNPIKALTEFHRVIKKNHGIIYLALPNTKSESSFDKDREFTTIEHLRNDYFSKDTEREVFDFTHFWEWVTKVGKRDTFASAHDEAKKLYEMGYSIHYHVFNEDSFPSLLDFMSDSLNINFKVLERYSDAYEFIFILKPVC